MAETAKTKTTKTKKPKAKTIKLAVVEVGGKQYLLRPGEELMVEKLSGAHKKGDTVTLDKVLFLDDGKKAEVGTPYLSGVKVEAEFLENKRGKKVTVLKYRRKVRYRKKTGHRQPYSKIRAVTHIFCTRSDV